MAGTAPLAGGFGVVRPVARSQRSQPRIVLSPTRKSAASAPWDSRPSCAAASTRARRAGE
jgi:hypothetical protein